MFKYCYFPKQAQVKYLWLQEYFEFILSIILLILGIV